MIGRPTEPNQTVQRMSAAGFGEDLGVWGALIADLVSDQNYEQAYLVENYMHGE